MKKSWKDVNIKEYYVITDIFNDKTTSDLEKEIKLLSLLSNVSEEEIEEYSYNKLKKELDNYSFVQDMPTEQIIKNEYKIGDKVYTMCKNVNKLTVAQYADIDTVSKMDDITKHLHVIASILFVEKGKKYADEDSEEKIEYMLNNLTVDVANDLTVFFYRYVINAIHYCLAQLKNLKKKNMTESQKKKYQNFIEFMEFYQL